MAPSRLEKVRDLVDHFKGRQARARERARQSPDGYWYFGIVGLVAEFPRHEFEDLAVLQPVEEPPGLIELARATKPNDLKLAAMGRYSPLITWELAVNRAVGDDPEDVFTTAWWIISALRVRTLADLLIPLVCDRSWSTLAAIEDHRCQVHIIEDAPRASTPRKEKVIIRSENVEWVNKHLTQFASLLENQRFRLAVDALTTHHHDPNVRMMTANLWSGIEALLGVESELSYRISVYAASILSPRGPDRRKLYKHMRSLYGLRSKAVHGVPLTREQLRQHVSEVRQVLSRMLCSFTEANRIPSEEDLEAAVFD